MNKKLKTNISNSHIVLENKQSTIFLNGEGDSWYKRNEFVLNNSSGGRDLDFLKRTLKFNKKNINKILEIGCANGIKLAGLCNFFNAQGFGVDPSSLAIRQVREQFKELKAIKSTALNLPYPDNQFDLVVFGFCLYLVDRSDILKAVAEADRVLAKGGFLAIVDFDPGLRQKKPYHHKDGMYSYKTSHSDFFTAGGHYYLVSKESYSHGKKNFSLDSNERISIAILYKEIDPY